MPMPARLIRTFAILLVVLGTWSLAPASAVPTTNKACTGGKAGAYPCQYVDLLAFVPLADLGGGEASDVWGWKDPQTGREYAVMGTVKGAVFVDITDTSNPVYRGYMPKPVPQLVWEDLEVYKDHLFVVCDLSPCGLQIFDMTRLRGEAVNGIWAPDVNYPLTPTTHTIDINPETGFAYLNGGFFPAGQPLILDVNIPKAPIPAGINADDGYTHDSLCRIYRGPDTRYNGKEICFNFNEDTITVYDMTNKLNPARLARVTYPGASYVHSGSLTVDHHYLLSDDETDNKNIVFIWDVSNLTAPQMIGQYTGDSPAIDHNTYIDGNYAYLANYKAGMRLLDLSEVATGTLTEVAYFDVAPQAPHGGYDGSWSVYPYLPSGKVLISGMNQGLFVVGVRFECLEEPQPPSCTA